LRLFDVFGRLKASWDFNLANSCLARDRLASAKSMTAQGAANRVLPNQRRLAGKEMITAAPGLSERERCRKEVSLMVAIRGREPRENVVTVPDRDVMVFERLRKAALPRPEPHRGPCNGHDPEHMIDAA
jgi:hypothetical protein